MRRLLVVAAAAVVAVALVLVPGATGRSQPQVQHVTLIGDSVADAIPGDTPAVALLGRELDLELEVAPCRRVAGEGCTVRGVRPPSVVDLVQAKGASLGANVVVAVGYNDFADQYAQNIEDALAALKAAGVKRVWWLTLRAAQHPYLGMNDDIEAAAGRHPELTVIEWNVYSRSHPEWFQGDGLHLLSLGAEAMATLIHKTLVADGVAPQDVRVKTTKLPPARRNRAYSARLAATAGIAPYRWSLLERAPAGIHLESNGAIVGRARAKVGSYTFNVRVTDASGTSSAGQLTLHVT